MKKGKDKNLIALFTNNDDDVYCFRKELIEAMIEEGYQVLISCPYGEKFELMKDNDFSYDDPDIDRRGTNLISDIGLFFHYFCLLLKHRPKVILTYTAKPNVYCGMAAYLLKIPVISNVTGFGSVLQKGGLMQKFIMRLFRFSFRRSACVMFQNATNMKLAEETGMVKGDHMLIPGSGVALSRYPVADYPDDESGVSFNYIGRILRDKGIDDYLASAKRIKEQYPDTQFHVLGFIEPTQSHYEEILQTMQAEGTIHYHGSQKDVRPFIAASHATIHPSTYGEGMSNVLLESASSGRPIISTDNPGCMETFIDGESGLMYHGGNVDELCERIEEFIALSNEERKNMGMKGRQYIQDNFSREIVIDAYLNKIKQLIERY
jgi:galacturonosyltransferase